MGHLSPVHEQQRRPKSQTPSLYFLSLNLSHQKPITPNPISIKTIHLLLEASTPKEPKTPNPISVKNIHLLLQASTLKEPKTPNPISVKKTIHLGCKKP
ncbi:hypothetical protein AMTRI_Chr11g99390 [Amborella trichopoda]